MLTSALRPWPRRHSRGWIQTARRGWIRFTATSASNSDTLPITVHEFHAHFQACRPMERWPEKLAIAFSGGSDSTCLLVLLKKLLSQNEETTNRDERLCLPKDLVAITIDHGLQATSRLMTSRCVELANALNVKHVTLSVPWGCPPFPALPGEGKPVELVARKARHHLLLSAMRAEGTSIIAFGHHLDDQVETALLRIAKGGDVGGSDGDRVDVETDGSIGAAGMRSCRRWGMGFGFAASGLGWAGHFGLNQWIVRPLLNFPKDRLMATCRASKLDYVEDKTNFQPDVGPRNRIRHSLKGVNDMTISHFCQLTKHPLKRDIKILFRKAGERLVPACDHSMMAELRNAIRALSKQVVALEHKVSRELSRCIRPSPVSSLLLQLDEASYLTDKSVRLGIIRRVLRYVSPFPWGSPNAVACGRTKSLQAAVECIWDNRNRSYRSRYPKFSIGGNVLWTPVVIARDGMMKRRNVIKPGEASAWLVSRLPPIRNFPPKHSVDIVGRESDAKLRSTELDITPNLLEAFLQKDQTEHIEILYDCRFLLRIKVHCLPAHVISALKHCVDEGRRSADEFPTYRVVIVPHSFYYLPEIVLRRGTSVPRASSSGEHKNSQDNQTRNEIKIARLLGDGSMDFPMYENNKMLEQPQDAREQPAANVCNSQAVKIEWVRLLDADVPCA